MSRLFLGVAVAGLLIVAACKEADNAPGLTGPGRDTLVAGGPREPFPPGTGSGGGDTTTTAPPSDTTGAGDPVSNGTWTSPDGSPTPIQPVDPTVYDTTGSGTAGTTGSSTTLVFKTSGSGLYGFGTCGPNGMWTDPDGNVFGPNNPNCLDYGSDGGPGNNGKGQCVTSGDGFPGLWVNPGGQDTHPFHPQCALTGATTTTLALSFPQPAQVFDANDGSGNRVLNFYSGGLIEAQLVYDGASDVTTGAGILIGTDNASPAHIWTVYFGQPALSYVTGLANGDLIGAMAGGGVQVIACNTAIGCSLVTLAVSLTP
jgi:hypothetical protein